MLINHVLRYRRTLSSLWACNLAMTLLRFRVIVCEKRNSPIIAQPSSRGMKLFWRFSVLVEHSIKFKRKYIEIGTPMLSLLFLEEFKYVSLRCHKGILQLSSAFDLVGKASSAPSSQTQGQREKNPQRSWWEEQWSSEKSPRHTFKTKNPGGTCNHTTETACRRWG